MSEAQLNQLQKIELQILIDTAKILKKNNIPFFLAYGTTLGCVRHQGFIPWDDDVDIYIYGKDYPKLKEVFKSQDTGYLQLHDFETVEGYPYVFPKIIDTRTKLKEKRCEHLNYTCGVYIDVFPLFEVYDNKIKRTITERIRYFRYALIHAYYINDAELSGVKKILVKIAKHLVKPNSIQRKLYNTYVSNKLKGMYYAEPNIFTEKALVKKNYFNSFKEMMFENCLMPIPFYYDQYLSDVYGDYMKLPDEKERVSNHSFSQLTLTE